MGQPRVGASTRRLGSALLPGKCFRSPGVPSSPKTRIGAGKRGGMARCYAECGGGLSRSLGRMKSSIGTLAACKTGPVGDSQGAVPVSSLIFRMHELVQEGILFPVAVVLKPGGKAVFLRTLVAAMKQVGIGLIEVKDRPSVSCAVAQHGMDALDVPRMSVGACLNLIYPPVENLASAQPLNEDVLPVEFFAGELGGDPEWILREPGWIVVDGGFGVHASRGMVAMYGGTASHLPCERCG
jgi:hypothetical protein